MFIRKSCVLIVNRHLDWKRNNMSFTTVIATNEDAEKLLKYLLAYRNRTDPERLLPERDVPTDDYISMGVIPPEEVVLVSADIRKKDR